MLNFLNLVIPTWGKYVAGAFLVAAVWGHGYVTGLEKAYTKVTKQTIVVYKKAEEVTQKVITKNVPKTKEIKQQGENLKKEGQAYAIKYKDDTYTFNADFVQLFNNSLFTDASALSRGANGNTK